MRRYTSILMLGARGVVMPLIVVLLLMSAAEAGLVFRGISGGWNPEWFWSESRVVWVTGRPSFCWRLHAAST